MECAWANNILVVETDGFTRPCCLEPRQSSRISPISDGIKKSWHHEKLIFLRKELLNGYSEKTRPWCSRCEDLELLNLPSLRTNTEKLSNTNNLKGIQFKLSNRCQLACAHCGPELSSTWAKISKSNFFIQEAIPNGSFELVMSDLIDLIPTLSWIKFTGGEPWMDPTHWRILERLQQVDKSNCDLIYITNGLTKYNPELWQGWKSVNITVSADGIGETYEWFRRGASWEKLVDSVNELSCIDVNLDISFSITPWTIKDWHESVRFWKHSVKPTPVLYPWFSSVASIPNNLIDLDKSLPFYDLIGTKSVDKNVLRDWAVGWDNQWKTPDQSKKLYPWLFV